MYIILNLGLVVLITILCISFPAVFSEEDDEDQNVCLLYSGKNFSGDTALLSLRPTVKVFDTHLLFDLDDQEPPPNSSNNQTGIRIQSVKLTKANCSLIICDEKHLEGNCAQFTQSNPDISSSEAEVYRSVRSVDCHCSYLNASQIVSLARTRFPKPSEKLQEGYPQPVKIPASATASCSVLFRDWHFSGQAFSLDFSGSTGKIDLGVGPRVRSILVKDGCTTILWNTHRNTHSVSKDVSFFEADAMEFKWACCFCDQCSETVCQQAQNISSIPVAPFPEDFSQFSKYGKKIIGIGRNYRWTKVEVAKYLSVPKEPIVFLKPTTSFIHEGAPIKLPRSLGTIFYELELGVVIGQRGSNIAESEALEYVAGYFLALDMTAKEFIKRSGNQSLPWEIGKGFDTACPVGKFIPKTFVPDPNNVHLECRVNGKVTQSENTSQMIFNVQQLISYVSKYMTLEPHDVILTGTPDGFGPVKEGDSIEGRLSNLTSIRFKAKEV